MAENNNTSMVNHPAHYTREGAMECIDEMLLIYGVKATKYFCLLSAHKYRYRAGEKGDALAAARDKRKSDWYIKKYKELKEIEAKQKRDSYTLDSAYISTQSSQPYSGILDIRPTDQQTSV